MDFLVSRKTQTFKFKRQSSPMFITNPKKVKQKKQSISTQKLYKKVFYPLKYPRSSNLKNGAVRWLYKIQILLFIKE